MQRPILNDSYFSITFAARTYIVLFIVPKYTFDYANGHIYIFDCGTGFRNLGKQLSQEHAGNGNGHPINAHIFLSHFHWDHIQGIPFFSPLYNDRDNSFVFHSSSRTRGLQQALEEQMADPYFPVNMSDMAAHRQFCTIDEGRTKLEGCT